VTHGPPWAIRDCRDAMKFNFSTRNWVAACVENPHVNLLVERSYTPGAQHDECGHQHSEMECVSHHYHWRTAVARGATLRSVHLLHLVRSISLSSTHGKRLRSGKSGRPRGPWDLIKSTTIVPFCGFRRQPCCPTRGLMSGAAW
jgi:hypothetical protein